MPGILSLLILSVSLHAATVRERCRGWAIALSEIELNANYREFGQSRDEVPIALSKEPLASVDIELAEGTPPELRAYFVQGDQIFWPQHPLNTFSGVPFFDSPRTQSMPGLHTASRSLLLPDAPIAASIKLPTNRPSPSILDPNRTALFEDMAVAIRRTNCIQARDKVLGSDPKIRFLHDVMAVKDKKTGNGFLVRDLRPLDDGTTWMPGQAALATYLQGLSTGSQVQ